MAKQGRDGTTEAAAATSAAKSAVLQVWARLLQGEWVMNRRELLSGLVATLAAGGVAASADVIESEPEPLLLVLKSDKPLNQDQYAAIRRDYDAMRMKDSRLPQLVVLDPSMTLEAVIDPRATV